jgi:rhamnogalacturonyl hydrolase YesR
MHVSKPGVGYPVFPFIFAMDQHPLFMVKSLIRYTTHLVQIAVRGNLRYVTWDLMKYFHGGGVFRHIPKTDATSREKALEIVMDWLLAAQKASPDNGFSSFHLATGWGSSYPETTGYIIPTLINYSRITNDDRYLSAALSAADFLLTIQKPSGGWQGGRVNDNKPEIVFNSGQVMRGLTAVYLHSGNGKYLDAVIKAADWLCEIQHLEGFWKDYALMNQARVYDAYVDAPLLTVYNITGVEKYRETALKNLLWITENKVRENGWFEDCDNTVKHNHRPILHTIAYTLDGLMESDELIRDGRFLETARTGANELKRQMLENDRLFGRYDQDWKGSEYFLCTGAAQMAIVWLRLYGYTGERSYLQAADQALDTLIHIQRRNFRENSDSLGAMQGSFPVWGRYEPFAFPNWASKFFADAMMMRLQIKDE